MAHRSEHRLHPLLFKWAGELNDGKIDRREFLRLSAIVGASAAAAASVAGFSLPRHAQAAETPKKGGVLRISMNVKELSDPATADWGEKGNLARHMCEQLVRISEDNQAEPWLAERWEASDDLKTWTFYLRKGVKWSNGDSFNADDVIFNFKRWLDPKTGSSNQSRFGALGKTVKTGKKDETGAEKTTIVLADGALEKVDEHTVRCHLQRADLAFPESLGDYPALIVHRDFEKNGANLAKSPVGTGPYTLVDYKVGEKATYRRRTDAPWWGGDVYLEGIQYIDHGDDPAARIAALASGQVEAVHEISIEQVDTVKALPNAEIHSVVTAQTGLARMHIRKKPFDNKKLRQAVIACVDSDRWLEIVYRGLGAPAEHHHVSPIHPEYAKLPKLKQDHAKAKALLKEAGYPDGIELSIDCVSNPTWEQNACKALAEMLKPAGIKLKINIMPGGTYWDNWKTTPFGFTAWTHRPLGVQVLNLAYRTGVPWNETGYANPEFDKLLDEAVSKVDVEERRKVIEKIEKILQDDAIICQALWRSVFSATQKKVKGYYAHLSLEHHLTHVWLS